jgi:hypothetical protein
LKTKTTPIDLKLYPYGFSEKNHVITMRSWTLSSQNENLYAKKKDPAFRTVSAH